MSYFNHAYEKVFVGTQTTAGNANVNLSNGFLTTAGLSTTILNQKSAVVNSNYGTGTFGAFNASTFQSVNTAGAPLGCCPLIFAAASVFSADSISPAIGGIQATRKSLKVDPNKVFKFVRTNPCTPQQQVLHIGNTNYTKTLSPTNATCCFTFLCNQQYNLRIDLKGSPVLRAFNKNLYRDAEYFTGCCTGVVPTPVDSTTVFIAWASFIVGDPYLSPFVSPIVYDQAGLPWSAPGTVGAPRTWDNYVSPGYLAGKCGGIRLLAAYTPTNFLDCTFQYFDHYEIAPITMYASLMDLVGDPCTFTGICVLTECPGLQAMGLGEKAVRDLILYEEYETQPFGSSDLRIREITLGNQELLALNRASYYYRYSIVHYIESRDNTVIAPDQVFRIDIITSVINTAFESFMSTWLSGCPGACNTLEIISCTPCTPLAP